MLLETNITKDQISKAEELLLQEGQTFDAERVTFIECFETIDLQAVPGSGKTTALLAKLIALENSLPLANGSGVLVLSHTNAAVEEIKRKISKHCPKLFRNPNFVGTIQSFVDTFLCIPAYTKRYGYKPSIIDDDAYINATYIPQACRGYLNNRSDKESILYLSRLTRDERLIYRPDYPATFPLKNANSSTYQALRNMKSEIRKRGILCFEDAYIIAEEYIREYPRLKNIIQRRFNFVFVDEMQDMDQLQYELLEEIFFDGGTAKCIFQRIGDRNQAIYGGSVSSDEIWVNRAKLLTITGSHRLSQPIANLVDCFAVHKESGLFINGLGKATIKPHLLVYDDDSITRVIDKYSELIIQHDGENHLITKDNHPIFVIGWIKDKEDQGKLSIIDYYPQYNKNITPNINELDCLDDYLSNINLGLREMKGIRKRIINAILRALRIEGIRNPSGAFYSEDGLIKYLKDLGDGSYEKFQIILYNSTVLLLKNKKDLVLHGLRVIIPEFMEKHFGVQVSKCKTYLEVETKTHNISIENSEVILNDNEINYEGFTIKVSTIHSVKGQTHSATLYLETYYHKDGNGENAKSYESQRLTSQFKFSPLKNSAGGRVKQSAKICYVGFSRPKYLLCVAVHKSRYTQYLSDIDIGKWEVVEVN